jgi:hypothetical protein
MKTATPLALGLLGLLGVVSVTLAIIVGWVRPSPLTPGVGLTKEEINACAVMVARVDYRRAYDWRAKRWSENARSQEDADQSFIVDNTETADFVAIAAAYGRRLSTKTVYQVYVDEGITLCRAMKARGELIEMPRLTVRPGYHVTRWAGSAALVKDGATEPAFGCMEGYRPTASDCSPVSR